MKYIVMDCKGGDVFTSEFDSMNDAIEEGKRQWDWLSDHDKTRRDSFYVLESVNPDEESENHFDGNVVWEAK